MLVKINEEECIGCGVCAQICPEVFQLDDEAGKARVVRAQGADCVQEAADSCPVGCIEISD